MTVAILILMCFCFFALGGGTWLLVSNGCTRFKRGSKKALSKSNIVNGKFFYYFIAGSESILSCSDKKIGNATSCHSIIIQGCSGVNPALFF